jgi:hypothetical protein
MAFWVPSAPIHAFSATPTSERTTSSALSAAFGTPCGHTQLVVLSESAAGGACFSTSAGIGVCKSCCAWRPPLCHASWRPARRDSGAVQHQVETKGMLGRPSSNGALRYRVGSGAPPCPPIVACRLPPLPLPANPHLTALACSTPCWQCLCGGEGRHGCSRWHLLPAACCWAAAGAAGAAAGHSPPALKASQAERLRMP